MKWWVFFHGVEEHFERLENGVIVGVGSKAVRVVQEAAVGYYNDCEEQVGNKEERPAFRFLEGVNAIKSCVELI